MIKELIVSLLFFLMLPFYRIIFKIHDESHLIPILVTRFSYSSRGQFKVGPVIVKISALTVVIRNNLHFEWRNERFV